MLCVLYNFAQAYREGIFKEIDSCWKTDWFFGENKTDILGLDLNKLSNSTILKTYHLYKNWYWQKGAVKLCNKREYTSFLILGEPYCLSTWFLAVMTRLFYPRKHLYFWSHGWYGKESKVVKHVKKIFFKLAHGIFLYGNYAKELMINEGFDPKRLYVIHNSLDYKKQVNIRKTLKLSDIYKNYFRNEHPVIIFIGRLTPVKHLDLLIYAIKKLKEAGKPVNLVLVGDGTMYNKLVKLVSILDLNNLIWFYGACYDEIRNAELIYNADLCVAPGNVGLTAIHSMVFGTPVISHNDFKWQMPEFEAIKPDITGDFFKKDNVDSLANTISNWFERNKKRDLVRKNCFEEIDSLWTPDYQLNVLKNNLIL